MSTEQQLWFTLDYGITTDTRLARLRRLERLSARFLALTLNIDTVFTEARLAKAKYRKIGVEVRKHTSQIKAAQLALILDEVLSDKDIERIEQAAR